LMLRGVFSTKHLQNAMARPPLRKPA